MNMSLVGGPSMGPPDLPYPPYPHHPLVGSDPSRRFPNPNGQLAQPTSGRLSPGPVRKSESFSDEGNRSRNAKAQRRHREKRKAQLQLLQQEIVDLEARCGSLTQQLNRCVSEGSGPVPLTQEFEAMQAENFHLRQNNQELRRQIGGRRPYSAGNMPLPGVGVEEANSTDGRVQGEYAHLGDPRAYEQEEMKYNHDPGFPGTHVQDMLRPHRSRISLSSGLNPSPYVASTFASADPRRHVDGRYSPDSGSATCRPPQADWQGTGPYDPPPLPHGPSTRVVPSNRVMDPDGGGQERTRESEPGNDGLSLFTSQNPYGSYTNEQGQQSYPYSGTPSYQGHIFPDHGRS